MQTQTSEAPSSASFLAEASKRLAMTFDLQAAVRCMTELSVPELGTASLVFLLEDEQTLTHLAAKHVEPRREHLVMGLLGPSITGRRASEPVLSVARSRQPAVVVVHELGLETALLVPVLSRARDRVVAVVAFLSDGTLHYGANHLRLADDLVCCFSLALEVATMYRACKCVVEDRQETLATTVHDVMSPLTYIKGTAQRLRNLEDGIVDVPSRTELRTRLEAIDSAASRIASALTALLHATELQLDDRHHRTFKPTDLVPLTRRAVAEQQLLARHHSILLRGTPGSLPGTWDECQLDRMLTNLIGNAVKYSPQGSVVDVDLSRDEDDDGGCWAVLRVTDQGVGIPARDLPFVFEPYHRGSNVGTIGGTGLGLASVWHTVRTHEGRLWVDSVEGKGTCVTVRLPANAFERPLSPPVV